MVSKRRTEQRRVRADELRAEASAKAGGLSESQRQAEDARAKAELAKSEAARAEEQAAQTEQGHQVEQASYEDKLREADRLDPDVDHKSSDYEPSVWDDQRRPGALRRRARGGARGDHRAAPSARPPPPAPPSAPADTPAETEAGATTDPPAEGTHTRTTE